VRAAFNIALDTWAPLAVAVNLWSALLLLALLSARTPAGESTSSQTASSPDQVSGRIGNSHRSTV